MEVGMDWRKPMSALIPGLEGAVLHHLWQVNQPRTATQVHGAARAGSLSGIRRALDRLAGQGVVTTGEAGNVVLYELNQDHLAYPAIEAALERYDPMTMLHDRLAELTRIHTVELAQQPTVAIYGSVARGEAAPESDLDLLLVLDDSAPGQMADILEGQLRVMGERWTGNHVHVFRCSASWLKDAKRREDPLLASWLAEAQTVHGRPVQELLAGVV
jgi:predicted nucleotidyltransferase